MKNLINKIFLAAAVGLVFVSCTKDETQTLTGGGTAPVLTPSTTAIVLSLAGAGTDGPSIGWTPSNYGYKAVVNYKLQYDKKGNNFAAAKEFDLGNNTNSKTFKQSEWNGIALSTGIAAGNAGDVDIRIKATIGLNALPVYSNITTVNIKTYDLIVFWYVPGDYQGWDPTNANCPKIGSADINTYEGYVYVPAGGTYQFKLTSDPDWNHINYGDNGGGTLNAGGGGNLSWPTAGGYYKVNANKSALTWSALKTTWALIGSAPTASNNWTNDVNMTYDIVNKVWKVTTNLVAGELKFRANAGWNLNYGDDGGTGKLTEGAANIVVTAAQAGSRTITLNLNNPRRYTYTIL